MKTSTHRFAIGLCILAYFTSSLAHAWQVSGSVRCDQNGNHQIDAGDTPVPGITIVVQNTAGTFHRTAVTGEDGTFRMEMTDLTDSYTAYMHPPSIPPGATILLPPGGTFAFELAWNKTEFNDAHFLLDCAPPAPPPPEDVDCGKITGGGWIDGTPSGAKGTFGVSGGIRRGEFWGNLNYVDHGTGMHVRSTAVTAFEDDPANENGRIIRYAVLIGSEAGTAVVRCIDNGEPGRDDVFEIVLSNGYSAGGSLGGSRPGGGNIQLHKCPPGWKKKK